MMLFLFMLTWASLCLDGQYERKVFWLRPTGAPHDSSLQIYLKRDRPRVSLTAGTHCWMIAIGRLRPQADFLELPQGPSPMEPFDDVSLKKRSPLIQLPKHFFRHQMFSGNISGVCAEGAL